MSQHRNNISIPLRLSDRPELQQCIDDTMMRVMVFCAADGIGLQDIAFPHQAELKVNGGEIKANLRGLKNKPGSTRPVDITEALRLRPQYGNSIDFTYALTQKGGSHPNSMGRAAEVWQKMEFRGVQSRTRFLLTERVCRNSTSVFTSAKLPP
jgi:hypothetical protein